MMRTADFDYHLPEHLIAQHPPVSRGESRMLVIDPRENTIEEHPFGLLPNFLNPGDAVVVNDTKVIRARLFGRKDTGANVELFLLRPDANARGKAACWEVLAKPAKRLARGTEISLLDFEGNPTPERVRILDKNPDGTCRIEIRSDNPDAVLRRCGHLPLPPYIKRADAPLDSERYQTVYADTPGAVAAPTAGLHFTNGMFLALAEKSVKKVPLTLHVGAGTFKPIAADSPETHVMHAESYSFPPDAAIELNRVRTSGNRILAVGTTSLRTLETCVRPDRSFAPGHGDTDIFLYPPRKIQSADLLLTNFHLPKSTLLMLVSAFAGVDFIRKAYHVAIEREFRFFSYGDCMLILNRI